MLKPGSQKPTRRVTKPKTHRPADCGELLPQLLRLDNQLRMKDVRGLQYLNFTQVTEIVAGESRRAQLAFLHKNQVNL